jgi:acetoacetyl-CoA synthetase
MNHCSPSVQTSRALWVPTSERIASSNITHFLAYLEKTLGLRFEDYASLHHWSVTQPEAFWESIAHYYQVQFHTQPQSILQKGLRFWEAQWFQGATLNYAEHLLKRRGADVALITYAERHPRRTFTFDELYQHVAAVQAGLTKAGVKAGDRVAGLLPNCGEALIAMLATTALGAIWSSCSPDFGVQGVLDRFNQIEPKVLFATNGYLYNGKPMDTQARVEQIYDQLTTTPELVWVDFFDPDTQFTPKAGYGTHWHRFLDKTVQQVHFVPMPFNAPLFILYSSGTTGKPKCIVHSTGGTLLQHIKELSLHTDIKQGDRLFYFTTCGWMMWNWLVSGLAVGATLILYDGSPMAPKPKVLWKITDDEGITHFGASAKYFASLNKFHYHPAKHFALTKLRTLLSTGSPLAPETFEYLYQNVKSDLCVSSISGGTDIISCFALGNPTLPVYAGELQCKGLGMDIDIVDPQGQPLTEEKGELVCYTPFPSMPIGFWNDDFNEKYKAAYFENYPGIWAHGDYGEITTHQGLLIHGRADAVLNPGGVRIGTAEIYRQVEAFDQVFEAVAVGQRWQGDERIILFVVMQPGQPLNDELKSAIKTRIKEHTTPRHVPAKIIQVPDIPKTLSGKIVEVAIRKTLHGETINNLEALKNPEALVYYRSLAELKS